MIDGADLPTEFLLDLCERGARRWEVELVLRPVWGVGQASAYEEDHEGVVLEERQSG